MAGAFAGHLVDSFYSSTRTINQSRGPFNQPMTSAPQISTHGAMSFDPQMHGTQPSFSFDSTCPSFMDMSEATAIKIAQLQTKLNQKLGPEYISQRPGPGGGPKLTYAEGWKIINLANEVFGFNGWSSSVASLTVDFIDFNEESRRYCVGVTAIIRVTLRDGVFHEDIGYGILENSKSKGAALDKCKKEAVTDGLKRALRNFGNLLGNCLYDKSYTQEVIKIKISPPKFDKENLHRRPEFSVPPSESKPNIVSTSTSSSSANASSSAASSNSSAAARPSKPPANQVPSSTHSFSITGTSRPPANNYQPNNNTSRSAPHPQGQGHRPLSSLPLHMRSEVSMTASTPNGPANHTPQHQINPSRPKSNAPEQRTIHASSSNPPPQPSPPAQDQDDSFTFNSEDDALLAAVDLGEGDLGRPIGEGDVDFGRPINFEDVDQGPGSRRSDTGGYGNVPERVSNNGAQQQHRHQHQHQNQHPTANQPRTTESNLNRSNPLSSFSTAVQQHITTSGAAVNQNQNPATSNINPSGPERPVTPSMGGFHFPPGMNPLAASKPSAPLQVQAGIKRNADSIQMQSQRRPIKGMGLAGEGRGGTRQVFGRLEVGEGGDVKRAKR